jgi:hypothetical protein
MNGRIVKTNVGLHLCEVRTDNHIKLVFRLPEDVRLRPGDVLELGALRLDVPFEARKAETGERFSIVVRSNDAHDLQLPLRHRGSRTPSKARLAGGGGPDA